jgi:hypothetical protein
MTQIERHLLEKLNFKLELFSELKVLTNSSLKQLSVINEESGEPNNNQLFDGIYLETSEIKATEIVYKFKEIYRYT